MDKKQVARILNEVGTMLELQGESSFRCNAWHNAARAIEQLEVNLDDLIANDELKNVKGIGKSLEEKITVLANTGQLDYYDELKTKTPNGFFEMLRVDGLGPKKIRALYEELNIDTLEKLKDACDFGEVAKLKGFGKKTEEKILKGIEFLREMGHRVRIDYALPLGLSLIEELKKAPGVQRIELCGSLRRRRETIKDIDILISSDDPEPIMEHFVNLPGVVQVVGHGDTKSSVVFEIGSGARRKLINADLRILEDGLFPFALHYFSGSKEHNIAMRARAQARGLKLSEYGLVGEDTSVSATEEADIFKALDLAYIPPEMREDTGEMELAEKNEMPELITGDDILGVFHNHTTASDGRDTLEDMADAARRLGFHYLGIADHSQSLQIANGLTVARLRSQREDIEKLNSELKKFRLFSGTECDILPDGELDFPDEVLKELDYVVASVHVGPKQTRDEMTKRIIKAIQNPYVTMLGHATGRLLLQRDAYEVDLEAVLQEAAKNGTMIEINAQPKRLELDWVHCKRAKALGVTLVINPDAHSTDDLSLFHYGIDVARRGWLEKGDVLNTLPVEEVEKRLKQKRNAG